METSGSAAADPHVARVDQPAIQYADVPMSRRPIMRFGVMGKPEEGHPSSNRPSSRRAEDFSHWGRQIINRYPVAEIETGSAHVTFLPVFNGFPIRLDFSHHQRVRLSMGAWSDEGYSVQTAGALVSTALAGRLRLRYSYDNDELVDVAVEVRARTNAWIEIASAANHFLRRLFGRVVKRTAYVQY